MTAYNAQAITNEKLDASYDELCKTTDIYIQEVLDKQIQFAAAFGRTCIVHLIPSVGIDRHVLRRWLLDEGYLVKIIGRILYIGW